MSGTTGLGRARSPGISKPALQAPRRKTLGKTEAPAPRPADAEVKTTKAKGTTLRAKDTQATARTMRREKVTKESVGRGGTLRRMSARPESTGPKPSPTDWKDPAFVKAQQALGNDVKTSLADADPSSPNTKVASQAADLVGTGKWTRKAGDGTHKTWDAQQPDVRCNCWDHALYCNFRAGNVTKDQVTSMYDRAAQKGQDAYDAAMPNALRNATMEVRADKTLRPTFYKDAFEKQLAEEKSATGTNPLKGKPAEATAFNARVDARTTQELQEYTQSKAESACEVVRNKAYNAEIGRSLNALPGRKGAEEVRPLDFEKIPPGNTVFFSQKYKGADQMGGISHVAVSVGGGKVLSLGYPDAEGEKARIMDIKDILPLMADVDSEGHQRTPVVRTAPPPRLPD